MNITYWLVFIILVPVVVFINSALILVISFPVTFTLGNTSLKGRPAGFIGSLFGSFVYWYFVINFVWQYFTGRSTPLAFLVLSFLLVFFTSRGTSAVAANEGNKLMGYSEMITIFILLVIGITSGRAFF